VGGSPDGASVGEGATRLGWELSPEGRVLRRAERRGVVTTAKSERDRRVTRIRLTERGLAIRGDVLARRRADLLAVLEAVGAVDPAGASLLDRLAEAFWPVV
jgi:DNA-binding MarR family transcriptional regulator